MTATSVLLRDVKILEADLGARNIVENVQYDRVLGWGDA